VSATLLAGNGRIPVIRTCPVATTETVKDVPLTEAMTSPLEVATTGGVKAVCPGKASELARGETV